MPYYLTPQDIYEALKREGFVNVPTAGETSKNAPALVRGRIYYAAKRLGRKATTHTMTDSIVGRLV